MRDSNHPRSDLSTYNREERYGKKRISQSDNPDQNTLGRAEVEIEKAKAAMTGLQMQIPESWPEANKRFTELDEAEKKARRSYRSNVDQAYETIAELRAVLDSAEDLTAAEAQLAALEAAIVNDSAEDAMVLIKESERALATIAGTSAIKSKLSKARRALKGKNPEPEKAIKELREGLQLFAAEVDWRTRTTVEMSPALASYDDAIKNSIGLRLQRRIPPEQIKAVASCQSVHRDYSLQF